MKVNPPIAELAATDIRSPSGVSTRSTTRGLTGIGLGNRPRQEARVARLGGLLRGGVFLVGQDAALAEPFGTLKRRADQVVERPDNDSMRGAVAKVPHLLRIVD